MLSLLLFAPLAQAAGPVPETAMKASYLYNFALYTDWPATTGDSLNLCVFNEDAFGNALDAIHGKQVQRMRLNVMRIASVGDARSCHIVFLSERERGLAARIAEQHGDMPILTVADGSALAPGIMVNMAVEDRRLVFYVNASAARRAKLNFSSKLLRLAKTVY